MIFFAPADDPATHQNLSILRVILPAEARALLGPDATREALLGALHDNNGDALFAMSHGEKKRLLAQNRTTTEELERAGVGVEEKKERLEAGRTTALECGDASRVGIRSLFFFACHTASELGRDLAIDGAVFWGYTGAINAPAENPGLAFLFTPIFEYVRDAWYSADTPHERQGILVQIALLCGSAEAKLDDLASQNADLDVGSAYLCLLHIWNRLRIWTRDAEEPEYHPGATMPLLLM